MSIAKNYHQVTEAIATACNRAGRSTADVHLIAVSKTHPVTLVEEAASFGQKDFAENRISELTDKKVHARISGIQWHLIGQLQTNKVKLLTQDIILHSLDRQSLAEKIAQRFGGQGAPEFVPGTSPSNPQTTDQAIKALIQVNCSREPNKSGVPLEKFDELVAYVAAQKAIRVLGLMTMAEDTQDEKTIRKAFSTLRSLSEKLAAQKIFPGYEAWLSMGMSGDFEHAIAEGATHVRIGSAIFGGRTLT